MKFAALGSHTPSKVNFMRLFPHTPSPHTFSGLACHPALDTRHPRLYHAVVPPPAENAKPLASGPAENAATPDVANLNEVEISRERLDGLVINVELTLVSIIQGVTLSFLTDTTRQLIAANSFEYYPYALNGLLIIFLFWSRAVIHTFTVIRWPLEFAHNFLYISCAFFEGISFANLSQPLLWYALQTMFAVLVWLLFVLDMRLIRARKAEFSGTPLAPLFSTIERDQKLNIIAVIPLFLLFYLVAAGSLWYQQTTDHTSRLHLWFAGAQTLGLTAYLIYLLRFFARYSPWLLARP
jgi:hypothetical protein